MNPVPDIPENALSYRFVRSSGPGGQHVNKVSTAVQLRLQLARTRLDKPALERLIR
ncbi:MAG: aminoacyl-tRNA hydrolase, partial [Gammaproteobacteria bacterium]|nr:aminoacyl-tRNA hydrolase [Gammaproteobacteria bacterium]